MENVWAQRYPEHHHNAVRKVVFLALAVGVEAALVAGLLSIDWQRVAPIVPPKILAWIETEQPPDPVKPKPPEAVVKQAARQEPVEVTRPVIEEPTVSESTPDAVALPDATGATGSIQPESTATAATGTPGPVVRKGMVPVHRVAPAYPLQARRNGTEGRVVAYLHVAPDGTVQRVQIIEASPRGVFEREVTKVLMQWRFAPEAVGFVGEVEIAFRLSGTETER